MNSLKWILNQTDENHSQIESNGQQRNKDESGDLTDSEMSLSSAHTTLVSSYDALYPHHRPVFRESNAPSLDSLASASASFQSVESRSRQQQPTFESPSSPELPKSKGPPLTKGGLPARRPGRKPKYAIPELLLSTSGLNQNTLPRSLTNSGILIITEEFQFDFRALMLKRNKSMAASAGSSSSSSSSNSSSLQSPSTPSTPTHSTPMTPSASNSRYAGLPQAPSLFP